MKKLLVVIVAVLATVGLALPVADAGGRPLSAELSSDNEVPPVETEATGSASVTLNQGQGEVCFDIAVEGLSGPPLAAHIHQGEAGVNGGVVVNLAIDTNGLSGCVDGVDGALIKAIRQDPAAYYVNVHTQENPGGEVRGQLSK